MPNAIQFWLKFDNGKEVLWFPVNPPNIKVSGSHGFNDIEVNGLGELTFIGDSKLREYSFSSFFPRDYNSVYCEYDDLHEPWHYVNLIEGWMEERQPIRLIVTGTTINMPVTIRSFSYEAERGGSVGDIYFDISFKEFVFPDLKRAVEVEKTSATVKNTPKRPDAGSQPKTYKVANGDSLWKIAQKIYGSGSKWRTIYDANKARIGKNPDLIRPGMELIIP